MVIFHSIQCLILSITTKERLQCKERGSQLITYSVKNTTILRELSQNTEKENCCKTKIS